MQMSIVHSFQQYCTPLLHLIKTEQYRSLLLTTMNNVGSKTLFNLVLLQTQKIVAV